MNQPLSGELQDDKLMDCYYARMREIYCSESHMYKKDIPQTFSKCMESDHFLSCHPKFELEIALDGSMRHPLKNSNSIIKKGELMDHSESTSDKRRALSIINGRQFTQPDKTRQNALLL